MTSNSRPTSRFDAELLRDGSQAFAACPCRTHEGEQYGLQKNRSSIQPGLSLVGSRSDRRFAGEFSRVGRSSLSYIGRYVSCIRCVNPNVGMRQTPQLFESGWPQAMQLHRPARHLGSTLLRFRCAEAPQHRGGLSGRPTPTAGRRALSSSLPLHSRPPQGGRDRPCELVTIPSTVDAPADIFGLGSGQSRGRRKRRSRHYPVCRQCRAHLRSRPRASSVRSHTDCSTAPALGCT